MTKFNFKAKGEDFGKHTKGPRGGDKSIRAKFYESAQQAVLSNLSTSRKNQPGQMKRGKGQRENIFFQSTTLGNLDDNECSLIIFVSPDRPGYALLLLTPSVAL